MRMAWSGFDGASTANEASGCGSHMAVFPKHYTFNESEPSHLWWV